MQTIKVKNPVLRGFSPGPNILRMKERYYIIISSFEWLPGIQVHESKNLVNWSHTTDILTTQVPLQGSPANRSIWAPQISYADGSFYLVYTDVEGAGRLFKGVHDCLTTISEIIGPWSEPIHLDGNGFDPSLLHNLEMGRKWLVSELWDCRLDTPNKSSGIVLQEYDAEKKRLDGSTYKIPVGTELAKAEAPYLYFHNGYYYLMTVEGGTGRRHSVTVCRAKNITGPYGSDPDFPTLTVSGKPASTLQCTGHGSLVRTPPGRWYMTYLCTRPLNGAIILGRETTIQEVYRTSDDWLRLKSNQTTPMEEIMIEINEEAQQEKDHQFMDTFEGELKENWNTRRILPNAGWCNTKCRLGFLRLISGGPPQPTFEHHLLVIRQADLTFDTEVASECMPNNLNQVAGLILYLDEPNYIYYYATWNKNRGKCLRMMELGNGVAQIGDWTIPLTGKKTFLKVTVEKETA